MSILLFYLGVGFGFSLFHLRMGGTFLEAAYLIVAWPHVVYLMWKDW